MSEFDLKKPEGPPLAPGRRAVRPRDAATLILVRKDGPKPRMLMGRRSSAHSFMPNLWVFPGGRTDRSDYRAPSATELRPAVAAALDRHLRPRRGRALAMAAVRETFEEAGLLLARPAPARRSAGPWRDFLAQGALPDLAALDVVGRAITPPMIAKRFDTWFLMADAERLVSLERQTDTGELEEIAWLEVSEALDLSLPQITRVIIEEAVQRLADPSRPRPFLRYLRGGMRPAHL